MPGSSRQAVFSMKLDKDYDFHAVEGRWQACWEQEGIYRFDPGADGPVFSVESYRRLWTALGLSVDWSQTYSTIDERCRRTSQQSFLDLYQRGLIERRNEPIQWCPYCRTALAQADLEPLERNASIHDIAFRS